ncbi:MAG TPA: ABC transporter permease [Planctomycetota bacterium]|nr:ABC transporter permease [Planctomycetota bacterium]
MGPLTRTLAGQGRALREAVLNAGFGLTVLLRSVVRLAPDLRLRWRFLLDQLIVCGITPLPVVGVVGVFTGMILAIQVGLELQVYGQAERLSDILGVILFREMGPFMTAMILTASVGAGMAAEIGTMAVSEELDGLECLSVDPVSFLCLPRILALAVMAPLLTFVGNVLGVLGGAIVSRTQLSVPASVYFRNVFDSLRADPDSPFGVLPEEILAGTLQALVFAVIIATVSCAAGLRATGGAIGVGRAVRGAVVSCFLLIMVVGYYMSWLLFR